MRPSASTSSASASRAAQLTPPAVVAPTDLRRVTFGVYLHVPFCAARCDYCAFATWTDRAHLVDAYLRAAADADRLAAAGMPPATSVFVGGGTPSLVPAGG